MATLCTSCGKEKTGRHGSVCNRCYLAKYYLENKERLQSIHKEYRKTHATEIKRQKAATYKANSKKIRARTAKYYTDNKVVCLAKMREYYAENAERINRRNRWYGRWRNITNREELLLKSREYYAANREKLNAMSRRYSKAHPEIGRENARIRRARKRNATIEIVNEKRVYDFCGNRCAYCGGTERLELDHIVALAAGGKHCESNLLVACRTCNASKGKKPVAKWLATRPMARSAA